MPPDDEDRVRAQPAEKLSVEERAELETGLAAARRGAFASEADVNAMYLGHGL
jgi:predicted transcriptional regulator